MRGSGRGEGGGQHFTLSGEGELEGLGLNLGHFGRRQLGHAHSGGLSAARFALAFGEGLLAGALSDGFLAAVEVVQTDVLSYNRGSEDFLCKCNDVCVCRSGRMGLWSASRFKHTA